MTRDDVIWLARFIANTTRPFDLDARADDIAIARQRGDDAWEAAAAMVEGRWSAEGPKLAGLPDNVVSLAGVRRPPPVDPRQAQAFGKRLYSLMLHKGWHQSETARQSGVPRERISAYVRGTAIPAGADLAALAHSFDLAPEELVRDLAETEQP